MLRLYAIRPAGSPPEWPITHAFFEEALSRARPPAPGPNVLHVAVDDDLPANWPEIRLLLRSLSPPPRVRPDAPPPARAWRLRAADSAILRSNGSVWAPAVNPERAALFLALPGVGPLVTYWTGVANDAAQPAAIRQAARTFLRLVRRGRQREGGQPDD